MKRAAPRISENKIAKHIGTSEELMSLTVGDLSSSNASRTASANNDPAASADGKDAASSSSSPSSVSAKGLIPDDVVKSARSMFQASGAQPQLGAVPGEEAAEKAIIVAGRCRGGGVCR
jgi:hypothetical protein